MRYIVQISLTSQFYHSFTSNIDFSIAIYFFAQNYNFNNKTNSQPIWLHKKKPIQAELVQPDFLLRTHTAFLLSFEGEQFC